MKLEIEDRDLSMLVEAISITRNATADGLADDKHRLERLRTKEFVELESRVKKGEEEFEALSRLQKIVLQAPGKVEKPIETTLAKAFLGKSPEPIIEKGPVEPGTKSIKVPRETQPPKVSRNGGSRAANGLKPSADLVGVFTAAIVAEKMHLNHKSAQNHLYRWRREGLVVHCGFAKYQLADAAQATKPVTEPNGHQPGTMALTTTAPVPVPSHALEAENNRLVNADYPHRPMSPSEYEALKKKDDEFVAGLNAGAKFTAGPEAEEGSNVNVKPDSARGILIGRTLNDPWGPLDLQSRLDGPNPQGRSYAWIAEWKRRGWIQTVGFNTYRKTERFGS